MKQSKRGQIKIGETIAVLFIFFVLVLFGLVFYYQWQKSSFERQKVETFSDKSVTTSLVASFLPELVCSKAEATPIKSCIDMEKFFITQKEIENQPEYYFEVLGMAKIWVEEIYPGEGNWTLYEQKPKDWTRRYSSALPMALNYPLEKKAKYQFGVLHVETYS